MGLILLEKESYESDRGMLVAQTERAQMKIEQLEKENLMLIYWLLKAYFAMNKASWEEGLTIGECSSKLVDVLANLGYDPNCDKEAAELLKRKPIYHADSTSEDWR